MGEISRCVLAASGRHRGEQSQGRMLPTPARLPRACVWPRARATIGWKSAELAFQQTVGANPALYSDYGLCVRILRAVEAVAITPAGPGSVKRLRRHCFSKTPRRVIAMLWCVAMPGRWRKSAGDGRFRRNGLLKRSGCILLANQGGVVRVHANRQQGGRIFVSNECG